MRAMVRSSLLAVGLFLVAPAAVARAEGAAVDVATTAQKASAQAHFEKAIKLFEKEKLAEALPEFQASYEDVASPNAHYMIARCLEGLGKNAAAYNALGAIEKEAKGLEKYAQTVKQSAELREKIAPKVGLVVVSVTGATGKAAATVNGAEVALDQPWAVDPGKLEVVALVDGKPERTQAGAVAPGVSRHFELDVSPQASPLGPDQHPPAVVPPTERPGPKRSGSKATGFYVGAGVLGAIAVGGFAVGIPFGVMAKSNRDDFVSHCDANQRCTFPEAGSAPSKQQAALDDRRSTIDDQSLAANIGFIVGGVAAAGSITLAIVGATRPKHAADDAGAQSSIGVAIAPGSITLEGTF
jgi:hypothetical protein